MNDISFEIQMNLIIDKFITTANSIEKIYDNLIKLEIEGKKNSTEYHKYIDYLSIAKESENILYDEYYLNESDFNTLIKMIIDTKIGANPLNDFESIIANKGKLNAIRRVVNILTYKLIANKEEKKFVDEDSEYQEQYLQYIDNLFYKRMVIANEIQMDLVNSFLLFLDGNIYNNEYFEIKHSLIKAKYNTCLIFRENENLLIGNRFKSINKIEDFTRMMAYCLGMTKEECNNIIQERIVKFIIKQIYKINYSKEDINSLIIRSCLIRGGLLLIDDSSLLEINEFYNKFKNNGNVEADKILGMCFYKMNEDRSKQISLKL